MAMPMPKRIFVAFQCTRSHQLGLNHVDNPHRIRADPVIAHQNGTCGAVQGENMAVQRQNAKISVRISFFMFHFCGGASPDSVYLEV